MILLNVTNAASVLIRLEIIIDIKKYTLERSPLYVTSVASVLIRQDILSDIKKHTQD